MSPRSATLLVLVALCSTAGATSHGGNTVPYDRPASLYPTWTFAQSPGENLLAEMDDYDDAVVYRAGPSEEEIDQQNREEDEKVQRAWQMLQNAPPARNSNAKPASPPASPPGGQQH